MDKGHVVITIPSYWTWGEAESGRDEDVFYDHPTRIDAEGTLARMLDSLANVEYERFDVVVITAVTHLELAEQSEDKVGRIISRYLDRLNVMQFGPQDLSFLRQRVTSYGFSSDFVDPRGYGNVRNVQLIVSHALEGTICVGLDDDETVGRHYLSEAVRFIGSEHAEVSVLGVAGIYLDKTGSYELPVDIERGNIFLDKGRYINAAVRTLASGSDRLVPTPLVFGGNMVLHKDLFSKIPFDPYIPRGEDIDYLISAALYGHRFFLDRELRITHLPPQDTDRSACVALKQDVERFIYEQEKIGVAGGFGLNTSVDLEPYPGRFLRDDLLEESLRALHEVCPARDGWSPQAFVDGARLRARDAARWYFSSQPQWEELMTQIGMDNILNKYIRSKFET